MGVAGMSLWDRHRARAPLPVNYVLRSKLSQTHPSSWIRELIVATGLKGYSRMSRVSIRVARFFRERSEYYAHYEHYCLMMLPSRRRISPQPPFRSRRSPCSEVPNG